MPDKRYWTSYWKQKNWSVNAQGQPILFSGGSFTKRGVSVGDVVYIVSQRAGQLPLGGRLIVGTFHTREEAVRIRKRNDLYGAPEWIHAQEHSGTPFDQNRRLAPEMTRRLRFISPQSDLCSGLLFVDHRNLDRQTTRVVRELTLESARLLDEIIEMTDHHRPEGIPVTVTDQLLRMFRSGRS